MRSSWVGDRHWPTPFSDRRCCCCEVVARKSKFVRRLESQGLENQVAHLALSHHPDISPLPTLRSESSDEQLQNEQLVFGKYIKARHIHAGMGSQLIVGLATPRLLVTPWRLSLGRIPTRKSLKRHFSRRMANDRMSGRHTSASLVFQCAGSPASV
jgi:hypothetical protein